MTRHGETAANAGASAFVRLLAHELRNYIAPMHNAMHLLRLKARGDPTLPPVLDLMERQLRGMLGALEFLYWFAALLLMGAIIGAFGAG